MIKKVNQLSVTEEAMIIIKKMILNLNVGDQIPTENQLQKELGISRQVIREVLINLQAEGYIEIRRGRGTFVIDKDEFSKKRFSEWFKNNEFKIEELIEIRLAIEPFVVKLATKRISDKGIKKLEESCERLPDLIKSKNIKSIVEEDENFHNIIFQAAKNEGMTFIYNSFIPSTRLYRSNAFSFPANPNLVIEAHNNILKSIKEKKIDEASNAMLQHIQESQNDIKKTYRYLKEK